MRKWWTWRKLVILLSLTAILLYVGLAVWLPNYPLGPSDKEEAAQRLVAWIVADKPLPSFQGAYPDAERMGSIKQVFVVCDFLPPGTTLSPDARVQRISAAQYDLVFRRNGYRETSYLVIELKHDTPETFTLEVSNVSGPLAGHQYRFVVYRKLIGLRLDGELIWGM